MGLKIIQSPKTGRYYPVSIAGEVPTEEEKERIRNYIFNQERGLLDTNQVEEQIETVSDDIEPARGLFGAVGVGVDQMQQLYGSALQGIGEMTGIDSLADYGGRVAEENAKQIEQKSEGLTSFEEAKTGVIPFAKFAGEQVAMAGPQILGVAALSVPAFLAGAPTTLAAILGSIGVSAPMLYGGNRERQKEKLAAEGKPVVVDESAALLTTVPQVAMESALFALATKIGKLGLVFNKSKLDEGGVFTKLKSEPPSSIPAFIRKYPKTSAILGGASAGFAVEGVTEAGQQFLERFQAGLDVASEDAIDEYIESLIAGGIVGGTLGGGISTVSELSRSKEKVDSAAELEEDLAEESLQNREDIQRVKENQNQEHLKLQAEQGAVITTGLSRNDEALGSSIPDPNSITVPEEQLSEAQLNEIRRMREATQPGIYYDNVKQDDGSTRKVLRDVPITLSEIRNTLGDVEMEYIAANLGFPVSRQDIPKAGKKKFNRTQYNKVLRAINNDSRDRLSETEINDLIEKSTNISSGEFIIALRNELVRRNVVRGTQPHVYEPVTGNMTPIDKVEFEKEPKVKTGRLAKQANDLERAIQFDEINLEERDLTVNEIKLKKDIKSLQKVVKDIRKKDKYFTVKPSELAARPYMVEEITGQTTKATTAKLLKEARDKEFSLVRLTSAPVFERTPSGRIKTNNIPIINKVLGTNFTTPSVNAKPETVKAKVAEIYKRMNTVLGKPKKIDQKPTALRKRISDLQEGIKAHKRSIELNKQALKSLQTNDFLIENTKFGLKGASNVNDPVILAGNQRIAREKIERQDRIIRENARAIKGLRKVSEENLETGKDNTKQQTEIAERTQLIEAAKEEKQKLQVDVEALQKRRDNATASVQENQEQQDANAANINREVAKTKETKERYKKAMNLIESSLRKYMIKDLGLTPDKVNLVTERVIQAPRGIVRGKTDLTDDGKAVITLATEIYDPELVTDKKRVREVYQRIKGILQHEVIHALRNLQLLSDDEFKVLADAAKKRKVKIWREGNLLERNYTFFDKINRTYGKNKDVLYPDMTNERFQEVLEEEAVAEMFRAYMDDKLEMAGKPKKLLDRILDFFRAIFKANQDHDFTQVDQIFEDIKSGVIGKQREPFAPPKEGVRTMYSLGDDVYDKARAEKVKEKDLDIYSLNPKINADNPDVEYDSPLGLVDAQKRSGNNYIKTVLMSIEDAKRFFPRRTDDDRINELAKIMSGENPAKIAPPHLYVSQSRFGDKTLITKGHEGAHRLRALEKLGYKHIAVDLLSQDGFQTGASEANVRADEQRRKDRMVEKGNVLAMGQKWGGTEKYKENATAYINANDYATIEYRRSLQFGVYSKALEEIELMKQKKGRGPDIRKYLKGRGVKDAELAWTGLDGILERPSVTKEDLLEQIGANRVLLDEVVRDEDASPQFLNFGSGRVMDIDEALGPDYFVMDAQDIVENDPNMAADSFDNAVIDFESRTQASIADINLPMSLRTPEEQAEFRKSIIEKNVPNYLEDGTNAIDLLTEIVAVYLEKAYLADDPIAKYVDSVTDLTITGNDNYGYRVFRDEDDSRFYENRLNQDRDGKEQYLGTFTEAETFALEYAENMGLLGPGDREVQYESSTYPGGFNYKERVMHIPHNTEAMRERRGSGYSANHFDEDDQIYFILTKDRSHHDGGKILNIDQFQSDQAQAGRKRGFRLDEITKRKRTEKALNELPQDEKELFDILNTFTIRNDGEGSSIRENIMSMFKGKKRIPFGEFYKYQIRRDGIVRSTESIRDVKEVASRYGIKEEYLPDVTKQGIESPEVRFDSLTSAAESILKPIQIFIEQAIQGNIMDSQGRKPIYDDTFHGIRSISDLKDWIDPQSPKGSKLLPVYNFKEEVGIGNIRLYGKPNSYSEYMNNIVTASQQQSILFGNTDPNYHSSYPTLNKTLLPLYDKQMEATDKITEARGSISSGSVTRGPLIEDTDTWVTLGAKRVLSLAVEEGYDYIAVNNGGAVEKIVGGGEGNKQFYDTVVPRHWNSFFRKIDPESVIQPPAYLVGDSSIPEQERRRINNHYNYTMTGQFEGSPIFVTNVFIKITPKLRQKAKEGNTLFSIGFADLPADAVRDQSGSEKRQQLEQFDSDDEKESNIREQQERINRAVEQRRLSIGFDDGPEEPKKTDKTQETSFRKKMQNNQHKMMYTASANFIADALAGKVKGVKLNPFVSDEKAQAMSDTFIELFQDRMISVSRMVDGIQKKGLTLDEAMDPIQQERIMHGKVGDKLETNQETIFQDMMDTVKKIKISDSDMRDLQRVSEVSSDPDQVGYVKTALDSHLRRGFFRKVLYGKKMGNNLVAAEAYLYAKHASERNDYVRRIDRNRINENPERGSGMSDAEADAIINWFEGKKSYIELLRKLDEQAQIVVLDTNKARIDGGLQPIFEENSGWKKYIPLKGVFHAEDETVDFTNRNPSSKALFGASGTEDARVKGRIDYAPHIIANLFTQNANSNIRAERNKVGLSMLKLLRTYPNELKEFAAIQDIPPERRVLDARTGILSTRKTTPQALLDDKRYLVLKEDGKEVVIRFEKESIAGAFRGDNDVQILPDAVVEKVGIFNRFLSNVNTSYNPAFIIPNFFRDLATAGVNMNQYESEKLSRKVMREALPYARGVMRAVAKQDFLLRKREIDTTSKEAKAYFDFVKAGGKNVTNQMTTLDDQINDVGKILDGISEAGLVGNAKKVKLGWVGEKTGSILSLVENLNTAAENGVRVATFKNLMDTGKYSPEQAALAAREITVNFARGGRLKKQLNSLYLFYNASIQGTFALLNAFAKSKKVRQVWMGIVGLGFMLDQFNAAMSDEDDEGNLEYDKIRDFVLEHNLLFPNFAAKIVGAEEDKTFVTIPLPYGINMAYNFGRALSRRLRGGYTAAQTTSTTLSTMIETVNPLGGTETFLNWVSPTVTDPVMSLLQNVDYDNTPIYKEVSQFDVGTPSSQAYWNTASPTAISTAEFLNYLGLGGPLTSKSAGYKVRSSMLDVSPDVLDYLFGYFTGGAGNFVRRSAELGKDVVTGDFFESFEESLTGQKARDQIRATPILRRFIYSTSEREDTGIFFKRRDQVFEARKELVNAIKSKDQNYINQVKSDYSEELRVYGIIRAINGKRQNLTAIRNKLIRADKEGLNDKAIKQRELQIERLDKQIQTLVSRGNKIMERVNLPFFQELLPSR
mgnify:FL=1